MSENPATTVDDRSSQKLEIDLRIEIDAAPGRVWSIISTLEGMRTWQGATVFEPWIGGRVEFELGPSGSLLQDEEAAYVMTGRVVGLEPERLIAYTWRQSAVGGEAWPDETLVTLTLEPHGDGTVVRVTHGGFEKLPGELAAAAHRDYRWGWEHHDDLARLKRMAEEGR